MLAAFTELKSAQKVKEFLIKKNLFHPDYKAFKELGHIYFPILKRIKVPGAKVVNSRLPFEKKASKITIENVLKNKLTKNQLSLLPKAQEIVGKIMILEVPEKLQKKEKLIAEAYLELNKNVETVVKKTNIHSGVYRTRKVKILAGKKSKETIHLENGVKIKLHLEKTYFSARSGNERLRVAKQVKKGENVLVMFSGAGPFPLVFAKNSQPKSIVGIELNPLAHQYALESIALNKMENQIVLHQGDVRTIVPPLRRKFDRVAMPLPKTGEEFLDLALRKVNVGGTIHLYSFLNELEMKSEAKRLAKEYPVKVLRTVKCGQFSPSVFRICFDLKKK